MSTTEQCHYFIVCFLATVPFSELISSLLIKTGLEKVRENAPGNGVYLIMTSSQ